MSDRFAEETKQVVGGAGVVARECGHDRIGTEHFVLSLLRQGQLEVDVAADEAAAWVRRAQPPATGPGASFTPHARQCIERALRESLAGGSPQILPRHLLIGALGVPGAGGARLLVEFGVDVPALLARLGGAVERPPVLPALGPPPPLPGRASLLRFYCGLILVYAVLCAPFAGLRAGPVLVGVPVLFGLLSLAFRQQQQRLARARTGGVLVASEDLRRALGIGRLEVYAGARRDRAVTFADLGIVGLTALTLRVSAPFVVAHEAGHVVRRDAARIRAALCVAEGLVISAVLGGTLWTMGFAVVAAVLLVVGVRWLGELGSDAIAVRWVGGAAAAGWLSYARILTGHRAPGPRGWLVRRTAWLSHPPLGLRARRWGRLADR